MIYLLVLAILLVARQFYYKPLQDLSLNLILHLQEGKSGSSAGTWTIVSGETAGALQLGTISMVMIRMPN